MSAPFIVSQDPYTGPDFSLDFSADDSYPLSSAAGQQVFSFPQGEWQFYPGSHFTSAPMRANSTLSHQNPQHQSNSRGHQRALSSSSVTSFPDSPNSRASSAPYPSTYNPSNQYLNAAWEGAYGGDSAPNQQIHLPTPSHTPTQPTFNMDNRRTASAQKTAPAQAASQALRSAFHTQNPSSCHALTPAAAAAARQSNVAQEWPTTPQTSAGDDSELHQNFSSATRHVPNLDRSYSDMCGDELYNPPPAASTPTSTAKGRTENTKYLSPTSNPLSERLHDANRARSAISQEARKPSPFRESSELYNQGQAPMQTAASLRQQNKMRSDVAAFESHHGRRTEDQPATVSPKDAFPEQPVPQEEEQMLSLFPASSSQSGNNENPFYASGFGGYNAGTSASFNFSSPSVSAAAPANGLHAHAQFGPYNSSSLGQSGMTQNFPDLPAHLYSMETTRSEELNSSQERQESPDSRPERPSNMLANRGTYSCTYHGCTQRFATAALLQKHKRDDHRSTGASSANGQRQPSGSPAMTQAGPHRCMRINPSTGKPCNTVFSRPYDLTRHEDTIHAERKKVRCPHCTEEKTFSRADALTRHLRVVHPSVRFPGKHSRRRLD